MAEITIINQLASMAGGSLGDFAPIVFLAIIIGSIIGLLYLIFFFGQERGD